MTANGALIRRLRLEAGWTVRDLAAKAGVSAGYLSRVENGRARPNAHWVAAVAAVYDVPTTVLLLPAGEAP